MKTKDICHISLFTAIICIVAPLSIPLAFTPVPISFANLIIFISAAILGAKKGVISVLLYIFIGAVGIPVFSGFSGGLHKIIGPTGGYIIGYIFCSFIIGFLTEKFENNIFIYAFSMVLGNLVCCLFGTVWLSYQAHMTFKSALMAGVVPYIIGDAIKIAFACTIAYPVKRQLLLYIKNA